MSLFKITLPGLLAAGAVCAAHAQQAPVVPSTPAPAPAAATESAKTPAKPDKADEENRVRVEFQEDRRIVTALYPNSSQAKLKVYSVNRFDPEIAKSREYFFIEMTGTAIVEPLKLDADDSASIQSIVSILERFGSEAEKSGSLKESMAKKKLEAEAELSREETKLVELQAAPAPDSTAVEASKDRIAKLKDAISLAEDVGAMTKITGVMGNAKLNIDRPSYDFVASFEPTKKLYTLNAGYSFQVAAGDVKFYVDLLKRTQEFKKQLLDREIKSKKLKQEVDDLFKEKKA